MAQWRDIFDRAQTSQDAASTLQLLQIYNVTQPTFAIGELIYSDTATTLASLAPNTTTDKKFLSMTGTGSAGAAPVWETIEAADITDFSEAVDDRVDALIQDASAGLTWSYNDGANTLTPVFANDLGALEALSGTNTIYYRSASDTWTAVTIHASLTFSGGTLSTTIAAAPDDAQYLTLATNSTLSAERVLTPGTGLTGSDGGAGLTYTLNVGAGTGITVNADDVALTVPVTVSLGGSGATSLTGLLQGNGTSAFTAITNSTTVGQVLRVTGSNTYAWGALDLADGDAITGVIPNANVNFASPAAIGSSTPAAGTFTTLSATSTISAVTSFSLSRSGNAPAIALTRTDTHGDAAQVGVITFTGVDSGAAAQQYAEIRVMATLDNAGAEEGDIKLFVTTGGTSTEIASITGATTTLTNALSVQGNTTLGNASTDTVVMNAKSITKPNLPSFLVYNSATDSNVTGNGTVATVDFDTEIMDRGGDFATDTFTAPVTGLYSFSGAIAISGLVADTSLVSINLVTSNRTYLLALVEANRASLGIPFATHADMDSGDTATITVTATGDAADNADILGVSSGSNPQTYWGGHLVG